MTKYEELLTKAEKEGINVLEINVGTSKKYGRYFDNVIVINSNMTDIEKREVLAEELGHHHTSHGNITDLNEIRNIKQELIARRDSYKILVEPNNIVEAMRKGANNIYEIAEHVHVTVDTLHQIIDDFRKQYGIGIQVGNYYLQFEPHFGIIQDFGGLVKYK